MGFVDLPGPWKEEAGEGLRWNQAGDAARAALVCAALAWLNFCS